MSYVPGRRTAVSSLLHFPSGNHAPHPGKRARWRLPRRPWTVRTYLVACVLIALVVVAVLQAVLAEHSLRDARNDTRERAAFEASLASSEVQESIRDAEATLAGVGGTIPIAQLLANPDKCTLTFSGVSAFNTGHVDIVMPDGSVPCSSVVAHGAPASASQAGAPWLATSLAATGPAISDVFKDGLTGEESIAITAPLKDAEHPDAGTAGVVAVVLAVQPLAAELASTYGGPAGFSFAITDQTGQRVLSSSGPDPDPADSADPALPAHHDMPVVGSHDGWIVASQPIGSLGWHVIAGRQASDALASTRSLLRWEALLAGLALLVVLLLLAVVYRQIANPLRRLAMAVTRVGHEVTPEPVDLSGPAELRAVAERFNAMIAARVSFEDRLSHDALHDPLTGLPNQVMLLDRLAVACDRQTSGSRVAVLAIGIDRFELVNTSLGYRTGDEALIALAARIESSLRPRQTLARVGGGEFAIALPDVADRDAALAEAAAVARTIAQPLDAAGTTLALTASIGVAVAEPSWSAEDLLRNATTAMHSAKEHGGARYEWFEPSLRVRANTRLRLENDLSRALDRGELYVDYQPVVSLPSRRITGAEALLRWRHPVHGVVSPATFVPLAEETGLIDPMGRFVLEEACAQAMAWHRLGYPMRVAVNVSGRQLLAGGFAEQVTAIIGKSGLPASFLCLELTETTLMEDVLRISTALHALKGHGVSLSIDDFGTGYSSLSYLQRFPVDELKVDRAFVAGIGQADDRNLVAAVIGIAHALDLRVVAEGVETEEQVGQLVTLGCRSAQGFLFARPQAPSQLTALLASQPIDLEAVSRT